MNHCLRISGVVAALVLLLTGLWHPQTALAATLAGALVWVNLALGCLLLGYICPLINGAWQPLLEPGVAMGSAWVPWIVPMLLPMLLGVHWLYPWAQAPAPGFRGVWLAPACFVLRTLLYGAAWWGLQRQVLRPAPGLIALVLLSSLAAIDWLLSLQVGLDSSVFGLLLIGRQLLGALALAGLVRRDSSRANVLRGLLVAALALWLYLQFIQFLITDWTRLPAESHWYHLRGEGVWAWLSALLFGLQLGCLVLLASPWGLRPALLRGVCVVIVLDSAVESLWLVLPGMGDGLALGLGVLGVWAYATLAGVWLWPRGASNG